MTKKKKKRNSIIRRFRRSEFGTWLISSIVKGLVNGLNRTLRMTWVDRASMDLCYQENRPFVFAYWHSDLILALRIGIEELANNPIVVMASPSRDGFLVANIMESAGMRVVRGSSQRGGMEAFMGFARCLRSGMNGSIAVDGPKGPPREVKDGVIRLSQLTGTPIIPYAVGYRRKVVLKTWDRLRIPLPFSRVAAVCGEPILIPSKLSEDQTREAARQLGEAITNLRKRLPYEMD